MDGITVTLKTQYVPHRAWLTVIAFTFTSIFNVQAHSSEGASLADASVNFLVKTVANEMAYALVAHECGKLRQPKMTAGYEAGVYMSMNKLSLPKTQVTNILMQDKTMTLTDTVSAQLLKGMDQGLTSCETIYKYVVQGLMPKLNIIGKQ
jgi:hypothetical protein